MNEIENKLIYLYNKNIENSLNIELLNLNIEILKKIVVDSKLISNNDMNKMLYNAKSKLEKDIKRMNEEYRLDSEFTKNKFIN